MSIFTLDELRSAWDRVLENHGCAGSDGYTVESFSHRLDRNLDLIQDLIDSRRYRPFPLLEIIVEKRQSRTGSPGATPGGAAPQPPAPPAPVKTRKLLVPAVRDRILQTAAARTLSHAFEPEFLECSFAYRPGRSVDRAIGRIKFLHERGYRYVVDADVHQFFDQIPHEILIHKLRERSSLDPALLQLIRQWIRAEVWDGHRVTALKAGVPQGSPISPLLANFFLEDFDTQIEKSGQRLIRYADDFLILTKEEPAAVEWLGRTVELLASLDLKLNLDKTRIVTFEEGFNFLGVHFIGDNIWIPWRGAKKLGRIVSMAHPMPAALRYKYLKPATPAEWQKQLQVAAVAPETPGRRRGGAGASAGSPNGGPQPLAFLYLTQQGAVLRKTGDRLLVEKDDQILADFPYHKLEHVLLFGNVQVTSQAIGELLEKGVPVSFLSRTGQYRGRLTPAAGKNVLLRAAQFRAALDPAVSLRWAQSLVAAKVRSGAAVVRQLAGNERRLRELEDRVGALEAAAEAAGGTASMDELNGVEGAAAKSYFSLVMEFNKSEFAWQGREQHPPKDPLNALLSFTYVLLTAELASLTEACGLDADVGFLHQLDYGRPSLALDLVELFRHPVADRFVLRSMNRALFIPDDFEKRSNSGVYLKQEVKEKFLVHFDHWMRQPAGEAPGGDESPELPKGLAWRDRLRQEVETVCRALTSAGGNGADAGAGAGAFAYQPFLYREPAADSGSHTDKAVASGVSQAESLR